LPVTGHLEIKKKKVPYLSVPTWVLPEPFHQGLEAIDFVINTMKITYLTYFKPPVKLICNLIDFDKTVIPALKAIKACGNGIAEQKTSL
jgi:hypothetical protein